jgi:dethiobiotin synthetase
VLDAAHARLTTAAPDGVIVEGAGGLLVPFTRAVDLGTLAGRWGCDLVVVAGDRLGVLNHVLLTVREAERRGLRVRAVVLVALRVTPGDVAEYTNLTVLRSLLPEVPVLPFPFVSDAQRDDAAHLALLGAPLADLLGGSAS